MFLTESLDKETTEDSFTKTFLVKFVKISLRIRIKNVKESDEITEICLVCGFYSDKQ